MITTDLVSFEYVTVDEVDFPEAIGMNSAFSTTGLDVYIVTSNEQFVLKPRLGKVPWRLVAGTVNLLLTDPAGNHTSVAATIGADGFSASALWTVPNTPGTWFRAWQVTDGTGILQVSKAFAFQVNANPG